MVGSLRFCEFCMVVGELLFRGSGKWKKLARFPVIVPFSWVEICDEVIFFS